MKMARAEAASGGKMLALKVTRVRSCAEDETIAEPKPTTAQRRASYHILPQRQTSPKARKHMVYHDGYNKEPPGSAMGGSKGRIWSQFAT